MKNNNLLEIQEMLMKEMRRLNNAEGESCNNEVARSNAMANNALTIIKSINVQLRVKEMAEKFGTTKKSLDKELGIE